MKPNKYEEIAWKKDLRVIGIDEVGRGCLAGPLVVSAAALPIGARYSLLKDSKQLSSSDREQAYAWITKHCLHTTVIISPQIVDYYNIYQATKLAMKKVFYQLIATHKRLLLRTEFLLIDAMPLEIPASIIPAQLQIHSFNKGESYSTSIAAASIVAKVTRDRLMNQLHKSLPLYGLDRHRGYGTNIHRTALLNNYPSIIHRTSFLKKIIPATNQKLSHQQQRCI